ncbi:MAG TPA: peptidoglycan recognition family protein, partial [Gemmatimonadaceae bacterium]|nr:peptidoglycan recognition family protein [Gemmatimonadaceae bacterium]
VIRVLQQETPNFASHSIPRDVKGVVLHIAEGGERAVDSWFAADASDVSAHFLVGLDGEIRQYVSVHDVAWHAGRVQAPTWRGLRRGNPNAYTVGIEHEGSGLTPWPEEQLYASSMLAAWVVARFGIPVNGLGFALHRQIFAGKTCPGPAFDFDNYLHRVAAVQRLLTKAELETVIVGIR